MATIFKRFHKDLTTLKAHHWKYYFDVYSGCTHNCLYCLYRKNPSFGSYASVKSEDFLSKIENELDEICSESSSPGIFYMGATSDIYQPLEKDLNLTRDVIKLFLKRRLPLVLGTKSTLILKDLDILSQMASKELIEVSITLITLDEKLAKIIEPNAPSVENRLNLISNLTEANIPVSIHVAPFIPKHFTDSDLRNFIVKLRDVGAVGMYSCILGIRKSYASEFFNAISKYDTKFSNELRKMYIIKDNDSAKSPWSNLVYKEMKQLSKICQEENFEFYCEHIPVLDTNSREGGIFNFKLPTTGDMYRKFFPNEKIEFDELGAFLRGYPTFDESYIKLVSQLWNEGKLFQDTYFYPINESNIQYNNAPLIKAYEHRNYIDLKVNEVMTCD